MCFNNYSTSDLRYIVCASEVRKGYTHEWWLIEDDLVVVSKFYNPFSILLLLFSLPYTSALALYIPENLQLKDE